MSSVKWQLVPSRRTVVWKTSSKGFGSKQFCLFLGEGGFTCRRDRSRSWAPVKFFAGWMIRFPKRLSWRSHPWTFFDLRPVCWYPMWISRDRGASVSSSSAVSKEKKTTLNPFQARARARARVCVCVYVMRWGWGGGGGCVRPWPVTIISKVVTSWFKIYCKYEANILQNVSKSKVDEILTEIRMYNIRINENQQYFFIGRFFLWSRFLPLLIMWSLQLFSVSQHVFICDLKVLWSSEITGRSGVQQTYKLRCPPLRVQIRERFPL